MPSDDLLDSLIEKVAGAVVRKIEEREKIDLIAQAVIARLEEQRGQGREQAAGEQAIEVNPTADKQRARASRYKRTQKTTSQRSDKMRQKKRG
ncbi:MAG: hypothetical protein NZT92_18130 [Abditibacteriales bacterium]|nr:hypothetical protein [Abditibacteriales bacterium]